MHSSISSVPHRIGRLAGWAVGSVLNHKWLAHSQDHSEIVNGTIQISHHDTYQIFFRSSKLDNHCRGDIIYDRSRSMNYDHEELLYNIKPQVLSAQ